MSDAEWDKEDYVPPTLAKPAVVDKWDGEDEDDVKESWDDDDPRENKSEADSQNGTDSAKASQPKKKKTLAQIIAEKEEKLRKDQERRLKAQEAARVLSPEELYEEKLRRQRIQEESDLQLAKEAFGITDSTPGTGIDSMNPSTKEEFEEFRKALVNKLLLFDKTSFFVPFLDDMFRELSVNLDPEDIKKLASTLNAVASEKAKLKIPKGKKKTKKAGLNVGKGSSDLNDIGETFGNEYDDFI